VAEDITFTSDRGTEIDSDSGDFASVTGGDNILQQVVLLSWDAFDAQIGVGFGPDDRIDLGLAIRETLDELDYSDEVTDITITKDDENTIEVRITTESDAYRRTLA
jgi:hypothetical protein